MSKKSLGALIRKQRKEKGFSYRGLESEMKKMAIMMCMDESGDGVMDDFLQKYESLDKKGKSKYLNDTYGSLDKKDKNAITYVNIVHLENGRFNTSREILTLIANALDYSVDGLLAESEQVVDDVAEIIKDKPDVVPDFLRSAKNLSREDWDELSKIVKKWNKK